MQIYYTLTPLPEHLQQNPPRRQPRGDYKYNYTHMLQKLEIGQGIEIKDFDTAAYHRTRELLKNRDGKTFACRRTRADEGTTSLVWRTR